MTSNPPISAAALAVTQELTSAEREQAHLYLRQTQNGVIGAIKGLSDSQWRFSPAPECWSVSQITEHVLFVLDRVGGPLQELLAQAPAPPAGRDYRHVDSIVIHQFPTRLAKFTSPEVARPTGRLTSVSEALELLGKSYAKLAERLDGRPDLRAHVLEAAPLKAITNGAYDVMDGYQWILAAAAHAARHTKQILEVKADRNFPAN